jgi:hypothetical protein
MGNVGDITMLPSHVRLRDAQAAVPEWGYLRQPRRNITVPQEHQAGFVAALKAPSRVASKQPSSGALENVRREAVVLGRSRNRRLRDEVIDASLGVCAACYWDYATVEPERWQGVLQAHHKKPLHLTEQAVVNKVSDLVALCPTCHVLAHLSSGNPRSLAQVRALFQRA